MGPIDSYLFGPRKKHPGGKKFATDADVKQAVTSLQTFDTDFFYIGMQALVTAVWQVVSVVTALRSGVYRLLRMRHVQAEVRIVLSALECLLQYWLLRYM